MLFTANIFLKGVPSQSPHAKDTVWEERFVLIKANDEEEAMNIAERIGREAEHNYEAANGVLVFWSYDKVGKIFTVDDEFMHTGTELFSRFLHSTDIDNLFKPFED